MKKVYRSLRLYLHYISVNVRCMMQYKTSFFLSAMGQFFVSFNVFWGIFFLFRRFPRVEGFTYSEVLLCFSIVLMQFSLAEMFARGFDTFSGTVRSGEFDRILVRPQNEIMQVLGNRFELTRIGRILQAIVMFGYSIVKSEVSWSFSKVVTLLFMLVGGTAVFAAFFIIYAALCFFTLDGLEFINIFTDGAREFGKYPIGIYGKRMLLFTTIFVPYAWIQYYPLLYLLGRRTDILYLFLPLAACWFLLPALCLWKFGVRHYQSSGS
ncbi:MAG: ABC-2 family transporter protein [Lachnospiraceae bacterium]|nr:ABC-2 family transporter protein [Lachnospiraceae bacterium]